MEVCPIYPRNDSRLGSNSDIDHSWNRRRERKERVLGVPKGADVPITVLKKKVGEIMHNQPLNPTPESVRRFAERFCGGAG